MATSDADERVRGLVKSFENALVYTTVLRNIDNLVQNKNDSILIMILASAIASVMVVLLEQHFKRTRLRYFQSPLFRNVSDLLVFLIEKMSDIVVQLTSSLSATLAISVFSSAKDVAWGLTGALVSLSLLWMIEQVITKKHA